MRESSNRASVAPPSGSTGHHHKKKKRKAPFIGRLANELPVNFHWKVLGNLVSDLKEHLGIEAVAIITKIIRERDGDALLELSREWGPQSISPSDNDSFHFGARYLVSAFLKKHVSLDEKSSTESRRKRAIVKYLAAEETCRIFNVEGYKALTSGERKHHVQLLYMKAFLRKVLGESPDDVDWEAGGRHGPGSCIGVSGNKVTSYYKFSQLPYPCTNATRPYAINAISQDQRWMRALIHELDPHKEGNYLPDVASSEEKSAFWNKVLTVVDVNKMAFVPKDARVARLIAVEPSMNMYCQLALEKVMCRRLKRSGIDLSSQTKNRAYARLGSLEGADDSFCTIDLESASDTVSIKLCKLILPPAWYYYLKSFRSPACMLDGVKQTHHMMSTMGNGTTFALESAVFAAVVHAVYCYQKHVTYMPPSEYSVYGDDIIVRKTLYNDTVDMLEVCGFTVNSEKSFSERPFKESCGADWYSGHPVRPVYMKDNPQDLMDLFVLMNKIKRHLHLRYFINDSETCRFLEKYIPPDALSIVGPCSDEEYSSYRHVDDPPDTSWRGYRFRFRRLIQIPRTFEVNDKGYFIALMSSLKGPERVSFNYMKEKRFDTGNRFRVTRRGVMQYGLVNSVTSFWCDEYHE